MVIVNVFILLTGRYYLYSGIAKTYLRGETGPSIYDLELFPVSKLKKSNKPYTFIVQKNPSVKLTKTDLEYHEEMDSKAFLISLFISLIKFPDSSVLNRDLLVNFSQISTN